MSFEVFDRDDYKYRDDLSLYNEVGRRYSDLERGSVVVYDIPNDENRNKHIFIKDENRYVLLSGVVTRENYVLFAMPLQFSGLNPLIASGVVSYFLINWDDVLFKYDVNNRENAEYNALADELGIDVPCGVYACNDTEYEDGSVTYDWYVYGICFYAGKPITYMKKINYVRNEGLNEELNDEAKCLRYEVKNRRNGYFLGMFDDHYLRGLFHIEQDFINSNSLSTNSRVGSDVHENSILFILDDNLISSVVPRRGGRQVSRPRNSVREEREEEKE